MIELKSIRLPICKACEHLDENDCCRLVAERENKPDKKGSIHHPAGLTNPCCDCPIKKFVFVPSRQVKKLLDKYPFLPRNVVKMFNRLDLSRIDSFKFATQLYPLIKEELPDVKLSRIKKTLDEAGKELTGWDEEDAHLTILK